MRLKGPSPQPHGCIEGDAGTTDGDMMLELNALPDTLWLSLQMINREPELTELFCDVLREEQLPFTVSECKQRYLPSIELPQA